MRLFAIVIGIPPVIISSILTVCLLIGYLLYPQKLTAQSSTMILVPMDDRQSDHLKSYGLAYKVLAKKLKVTWVLNYRGGSFLLPNQPWIWDKAVLQGIKLEQANPDKIQQEINAKGLNSSMVVLEKAPKIAVYTPGDADPWDDAVRMAMEYANIPYDKIFDDKIQSSEGIKYDWLHLHHEDFTGQLGKFYANFRQEAWYQQAKILAQKKAELAGFKKISEYKLATARAIANYVAQGGFLFAMCSATDTLDIALAADGVDIVETPLDGDPADPDGQQKLKFEKTLAFENFQLVQDPLIYEFSNIDIDPRAEKIIREKDYFSLFEFSAKLDQTPALLTQNHVNVVPGFLGQTTAFSRDKIKKRIIILGESEGTNRVRYIYGTYGKGHFSFYGGHDPEDYQHMVGDPPTNLKLHKNSPGYRLILNNLLFPAAKLKKLKT